MNPATLSLELKVANVLERLLIDTGSEIPNNDLRYIASHLINTISEHRDNADRHASSNKRRSNRYSWKDPGLSWITS